MELRRLQTEDVAGCEALAREHGWEVGEARWRLLLASGLGWGAFTAEGLVGTALRFDFGSVAVVAMVLVRRSLGRGGVGRMLVERALVGAPATTFLYATAQGRGLYERMGFVALSDCARFTGAVREVAHPRPTRLATLDVSGLAEAFRLDEESFGGPRAPVLERLGNEAVRRLGAWEAGRLVGFGMVTRVGTQLFAGPIVARTGEVGVQLAAGLTEGLNEPVRLDLPLAQHELVAWAQAAGLQRETPIPLMSLGGRPLPGRRDQIFALASRGLG